MGNNETHLQHSREETEKATKINSVCCYNISQSVTVWIWNVPQKLMCWTFGCQLRSYFGALKLEGGQMEQVNLAFEGYSWSPVPSSFTCFLSTMRGTAFSIFFHCYDLLPEYMGSRHNGSIPLKPLNCSPSIWVIATADILIISKVFHYRGWRDGSVAKSIYHSCKGPVSGSQYSCQTAHNHL